MLVEVPPELFLYSCELYRSTHIHTLSPPRPLKHQGLPELFREHLKTGKKTCVCEQQHKKKSLDEIQELVMKIFGQKTCLPVRLRTPAVYADVNVVFRVHQNTKLKPRCLIKCAR